MKVTWICDVSEEEAVVEEGEEEEKEREGWGWKMLFSCWAF